MILYKSGHRSHLKSILPQLLYEQKLSLNDHRLDSGSNGTHVTLERRKGTRSIMMDPSSSSNSNKATLSGGLCSSNIEDNQDAYKSVRELLSEAVRGWISQHPRRGEACSLESEETYMAQTFARFYHLAAHQQVEFSQLSIALQCLKVCLNAAILDRLRAASRLRTIPLSSSDDAGESSVAYTTDAVNIWKILIESFPSSRDQRLTYLLFHCGLSPKEIVHAHPQEFTDVREISRLRQAILEQMLHHADHFDDW